MEFHKLESDDVNERDIRLDPFQTFLKNKFFKYFKFYKYSQRFSDIFLKFLQDVWHPMLLINF